MATPDDYKVLRAWTFDDNGEMHEVEDVSKIKLEQWEIDEMEADEREFEELQKELEEIEAQEAEAEEEELQLRELEALEGVELNDFNRSL